MEIKSRFDHFNINVTNLERSIAFYEKALGLKNIVGRKVFRRFFHPGLPDGQRNRLPTELTWLKDHTSPMNWEKTKVIYAFV